MIVWSCQEIRSVMDIYCGLYKMCYRIPSKRTIANNTISYSIFCIVNGACSRP